MQVILRGSTRQGMIMTQSETYFGRFAVALAKCWAGGVVLGRFGRVSRSSGTEQRVDPAARAQLAVTRTVGRRECSLSSAGKQPAFTTLFGACTFDVPAASALGHSPQNSLARLAPAVAT